LIGTDTVAVKSDIASSVLGIIDAGLGIEVNEVDGQIVIESLSIEDSIKNQTGTLIEKGTPLYATGIQGNYWTVAPARADDPSKMPAVVIAGEDIAAGGTGLGLIKGHIKQVNTTGLADGAEVYVASGGGYTSTKPTAEGVIIQRLGTVIKGDVEKGSGIINLGDEAYWNDYTSLTKLRDTLVIFRDSVTNQIGDSLLLYVDRTELGDSLLLYPNRVELGDTANAIRADIPSLSGVVLTTTDQSISGVKSFQDDVSIDGALDIAYRGNTYLGNYAGYGIRQDLTTARNVIIGTEAYFTENYANDNVVIGYFAGRNTEYGSNVIIGSNANYFTSPSYVIASNAVVIGKSAKTTTTQSNNSIVIGANATGLGDDTAVIGDGQMTKLNSNKYTFNVDQDTTGKNGYLLGLNSSSGEIELQDISGSYINRTELSDTALAIRTDIPLIINDSLTARNFLTENQNITLSGDVSGSGTTSIITTVADDSHNHVISNVDNLQNSLNAKQDNLSGTGIVKSTGGTISYLTDNSSNWNNAYNDRITTASFSGTTTKILTLNQQDGGTVTASFTDDTGGGLTGTNQGNNRIPTFKSADNIDGDNGFWINDHYELVDNLLDGTASSTVGYQLKLSHTAFIDSVEVNYLDVNNNLTLDNDLEVLGTSNFDGSVGDSYFYPSGALGIQTTPSGNLSLTTKYGAVFNTDNNSLNGDVTMNGGTTANLFNLDASEDAIAIGGSTPNSSFDLKTSKGVWINSSYSGGINDGLLVSGDTYIYLLNVDADKDKVGINKVTPAYTLDVDGDINFTGDLYDDGSLVSFTGTTINNNADNRIITGSNTANTLEGESSLLFDGEDLELQSTTTNAILRLQNSNSGYTTSDGFAISSTTSSVYVSNKEPGDIWIYTDNDFTKMIILRANGTVDLTHYSGSGNQELGVDNSGEIIFYSASDGRHKKRVTSNIKGIEAVMKLKPLEYQWNKDVPNYDGHNEIGFIAQEVKEVIPLAVPYDEDKVNMLGIKDRAIIATLTKAIQEQQEMIEDLQKEIKRIKRKIK
jgi:hypothetical protein